MSAAAPAAEVVTVAESTVATVVVPEET